MEIEPVTSSLLATCRACVAEGRRGGRVYFIRAHLLGKPALLAVEITQGDLRRLLRGGMTVFERLAMFGLVTAGSKADYEAAKQLEQRARREAKQEGE